MLTMFLRKPHLASLSNWFVFCSEISILFELADFCFDSTVDFDYVYIFWAIVYALFAWDIELSFYLDST
jgi:hypothetical protein